MSIFMTPEQRPFFAGTYFPKYSRRGAFGFRDLLLLIHEKWESDRASLLRSAGEITGLLGRASAAAAQADATLPEKALELYRGALTGSSAASAPRRSSPRRTTCCF